MKSVQNKESGAWLHAFSWKNNGKIMHDRSFQINIGLVDLDVIFVKNVSVVVVVKLWSRKVSTLCPA